MPESERLSIDPLRPEPAAIRLAGRILRSDGIICFPTSGLYGLGAIWDNERAIERIYAIKGRDRSKPILILVPSADEIPALVTEIPDVARRLMQRFWPGRLTLIFRAASHVSRHLTAGSEKIGLRLPMHPVAKAILQEAGVPLTGTSANLSGDAGCDVIESLSPAIRTAVDLVLDAGKLTGGAGSTVVDVTADPVRVLRWGAVGMNELREWIDS
ncbi:L-threonylcarbamoyladenylate synthase [Desulfatirhabdium butyrativorans]|uniref:L-threonylcarbamoyladenylate synthase n=1 Tax=Desulfatirhabdium butyrativorans TaxID=340467 RepID=UPI0004028306|nr:L-threonylcarbamoyladenylate synthase [Desulfatirhabdium butyrativorans]